MPEFGFRYYDPNTGQWLSREPLGESESLNLYAYCRNDPINKVDLLGLQEVAVNQGAADARLSMLVNLEMISRAGGDILKADIPQEAKEEIVLQMAMQSWLFEQRSIAEANYRRAYEEGLRFARPSSLVGAQAYATQPLRIGALNQGAMNEGAIATSQMNLSVSAHVGANVFLWEWGIPKLAAMLRTGNIMRQGMAFNQARLLNAIGTELRAGSLVGASGGSVTALNQFVRSGHFAQAMKHPVFVTRPAAAGWPEAGTLFRGTSSNFPGSPGTVQLGITPATHDPVVATLFAMESSNYGPGIVYAASPRALSGVRIEAGNVLASLEREVGVMLPPAQFATRADTALTVGQARAILIDMGVDLPGKIRGAPMLQSALESTQRLTPAQIREFLRRAGQLTPVPR